MFVSKVLVAANIQSQYDAINYFCSEVYEGYTFRDMAGRIIADIESTY